MSPCRLVALLILLLAGSALRSQGASRTGELRCKCISMVSEMIPPKFFASVKLISEGPHCAVSEVIATLKNKKEVCLDPTAKWVGLIVNKLLKNRNTRRL